jgi:hypothetical protein
MRSFLVALCAAASPVHAQPAAELTSEFQAGVDAYRLGKLDDARAHLEKARALDPKLPGPHRFLAAVARAQGRWQDCLDEAREALVLNPQSTEAADTRKLHGECRIAAGRAPFRGELADSAAIAVETSTPDATVKIGGLVYGVSPLAPRPIAPGALDIDVEKPGWKPAHVHVDAPRGIVTDVAIELEPDPAGAQENAVTAAPSVTTGTLVVQRSWRLSVDGKPATGGERVELAPGTHAIEIDEPEMDPWRRRVRISAGQQVHISPVFVVTERRERRERTGITVLVAGGALFAAGFATALVSEHASSEARDIVRVETARDPSRPLSETGAIEPVRTRADFEDARTRAHRFALISDASYAAGFVAAGIGTYLLYTARRDREDAPPPFAVVPLTGGAMIAKELAW